MLKETGVETQLEEDIGFEFIDLVRTSKLLLMIREDDLIDSFAGDRALIKNNSILS